MMSDGGAVSMHDDCPVCLQVLFHPTLLPCGHHYCAQCWQRVSDTAAFNERDPRCPVCRSTAFTVQLDTALEAALQQRHPEAWGARAQQHEAELHLKQLCQRRAEEQAADEQAAAEEHEAEEWEEGADGRATRRMTAALVLRCARAQSPYRTARLASKLEMSLLCLRDVSPSLSQYSLLTSLRVEHNAIESFAGLQLPLLKVLVAHHNRLHSLALEGTPRLLLLDVGSNRLTSLAGVEQCTQLAQLTASSNRIGGEGALAPLLRCEELSTLQLASNQIASVAELSPLAQLRNLRSLVLAPNPVDGAGRSRLLEVLPQLRLLDAIPNHALERAEHREKMRARQESIARSTAMMRRIKEKAEAKRAAAREQGEPLASPALPPNCGERCGPGAVPMRRDTHSACGGPAAQAGAPATGAPIAATEESVPLPSKHIAGSPDAHSSPQQGVREGTQAPALESSTVHMQSRLALDQTRRASRDDVEADIPGRQSCSFQSTGDSNLIAADGCARSKCYPLIRTPTVYTSGMHSRHFEHPAEDVRLSWSEAADAVLAGFVRQACFDFDKAALMMTAWMQEMQQADGNSHAAAATAKQCRLRWAFMDQRICSLATQLEEEWLSVD